MTRLIQFFFVIFFISIVLQSEAQFADPLYLGTETVLKAADDVDLDGDQDLLFTSGFSSVQIGYIENIGGSIANFPRHIIPAISGFIMKSVEDIDNDGDKDFVGERVDTNSNVIEMGWCENINGPDEWPWHAIDTQLETLMLFDYDRDGDLDVAEDFYIYNLPNYQLGLMTNDGTGQFSTELTYVPYRLLQTPRFEHPHTDLDGDGISDGVSEDLGDLEFILSTNSFLFSTTYLSDIDIVVDIHYDFDMNGYADLLVHEELGDFDQYYIAWDPYLNGINLEPQDFQIVESSPFVVSDVNGDSFPDIIHMSDPALSGGNAYSYTYYLQQDGQFVGVSSTEQPLLFTDDIYVVPYYDDTESYTRTPTLNIFDLDNDGDCDQVFEFNGSGPQYLSIQQPDGAFLPVSTRTIPYLHAYGWEDVGHDYNIDGLSDISCNSSPLTNDVHYVTYNSNVTITNHSFGHEIYPEYSDQIWSQIDGDGFEDFIIWNDSVLYLYISAPEGPELLQTLVAMNDIFSVWITDANGDGESDVICELYDFSTYEVQTVVFIRQGEFFLSDYQLITPFESYMGMSKPFDLDLDGDLDLVYWVNSALENVHYLLNTGILPWEEITQPIFPILANNTTLDVNGDGLMEQIIYGITPQSVPYFRILFSSLTGEEIYTPIYYGHPEFADLNKNGLPEMYVTAATSLDTVLANNLIVYECDPYGIIHSLDTIPLLNGSELLLPLAFGDVNQDGYEDIFFGKNAAIGTSYDGTCYWSQNPASTPFAFYGRTYIDYNQNGNYSVDEPEMNGMNVLINGSSMVVANGYYSFIGDAGTYEAIVQYDDTEWMLTTTSTYTATVSVEDPVITNLDFGFYPLNTVLDYDVDFYFQQVPCGDATSAQLLLENTGTAPLEFVVNFPQDISSNIYFDPSQADSLVNEVLYTHTMIVNPGNSTTIEFSGWNPSVEFLGDTLHFPFHICAYDAFSSNSICADASFNYIVSCAFDPNMITVQPAGYLEEGFILNGTQLEYTIEFENTGTADAVNIYVTDSLSEFLDFSSLEVISSSHNVETFIDEARAVHFTFPYIYLGTMFYNNHGFVRYRINLAGELPAGTEILNTAYIYFDNNPAIVTNTEVNTIFDCDMIGVCTPSGTICEGESFEFDPQLEYVDSYAWYLNGELISSDASPDYIPDSSFIGNVTLEVSNPLCLRTYEGEIEILDAPSIPVIVQSGNTLIIPFTEDDIQWFHADQIVPGATTNELQITQNGAYRVEVSNENCSRSSSTQFFIYTGLFERSNSSLLVYPNPVSDEIYIQSYEGSEINLINIFDNTGKIVYSKGGINQLIMCCDLGHLSMGMYRMQVCLSSGENINRTISVK